MKSKLSLLFAIMMLLTLVAACGGGTDGADSGIPAATPPPDNQGTNDPGEVDTDEGWGDATYDGEYVPPLTDFAMEIDILLWSGAGTYLRDLGNQDWGPEDLFGQNEAKAYAIAKEFNKIYPNVVINILAVDGGPEEAAGGAGWAQELENFRAEYGKYPDIWASFDMFGDIRKGLVADISIFENDPVYRSFNKGIMDMMNYNGRQFGLPQYIVPWGIFVNRTLAEQNNIDIPDPDWTLEEYTRFISNSVPNEWYGAPDAEIISINTMAKGFAYQMLNRGPGDPFVIFDSPEFYAILEHIPRWANHAVWPQADIENVDEGFMDWWWSPRWFQTGKTLTLAGDPWFMGDFAHPDPNHWFHVAFDFDIYPRPSTADVPSHVGLVLDPMVIHNYHAYVDAGQLTEEEADMKLKMAWEFAKFFSADTRAWQAAADQMFSDVNDDGTVVFKTSLNDSMPLVVGRAFHDQMEIWYSTETHARYKNNPNMPGWQAVLELWEAGQVWDYSDKAYPRFFEYDGSSREILFEWHNSWNPDVNGGVRRTDANWLDTIKARMPDWNREINERFERVFAETDDAIARFYR